MATIPSIGGGGALAREAVEAAMRSVARSAERVDAQVARTFAVAGGSPAEAPVASGAIGRGVEAVRAELERADALPSDLLLGKVGDFHEVAARLRQSELTFKFTLEVRNKLIDAYRETMRMSV